MFSKFYIKFNYKNIVPFNLKKKKMRIFANLIANKAVAAQGFFFGVKIKFWYYYYGINGLKKDNILLIKNSLNKKLSVFFISNFNMIEGRWALPKIYEEYYQKNIFLKKKIYNIARINLIWNYNNNNYAYSNTYNNIFLKKNIYKLIFLYFWKNIKNWDISKKQKFINKFSKKKFIPIIYNFSSKTKKKKLIFPLNFIKNIKYKKKLVKRKMRKKKLKYHKKKKKYVKKKQRKKQIKNYYLKLKKQYLLKFTVKKNIINIKQFIKLSNIILQEYKNNMLFLFYKLFYNFKYLKIKNNLIICYLLKNNLKNNLLKNNLKKLNKKLNNNLINTFKNLYSSKLILNKSLKLNKTHIYAKLFKKLSNNFKYYLNKKKKFWTYYTNFYLLGKGNLCFDLKNRKIIRKKYKKIVKYNYYIKSLFFRKKKKIKYDLNVKLAVIQFFKKKFKIVKKNQQKLKLKKKNFRN